MTEPRPVDDELVSALLDDALTDEERARLADDPAVAARLAELRAVRDLVAAPVPAPDPARRDAAIAAALAAADPGPVGATTAGGGPTAPVIDLAARRRTRALAGLSAAAAVLVVVLLTAGLLRAGGGRSADTTTAAAPPSSAAPPRSAAGEAAPSAGSEDGTSEKTAAGEQPTAAPDQGIVPDLTAPAAGGTGTDSAASVPTPVDLGSLGSPEELRRAADRAFAVAPGSGGAPAGPTTAPSAAETVVPPPSTVLPGAPSTTRWSDPVASDGAPNNTTCADATSARAPGLGAFHGGDPRLGAVLGRGTATYQGRPVVVVAFAATGGGDPPRVLAVDPATCRLVALAPG